MCYNNVPHRLSSGAIDINDNEISLVAEHQKN